MYAAGYKRAAPNGLGRPRGLGPRWRGLVATRVRYDREHRRVYVADRRLHHGLVGSALVIAGLALCVHDRRDRRVWLNDFRQLSRV